MGGRVANNVVWNLVGSLSSMVVGLVALPVLLHTLGAARLGVFTLALGFVGMSGLLDLGLGRALTQAISSALGVGQNRMMVAALVWHILRRLLFLGVLWALALWWFVPLLVSNLFGFQGQLAVESVLGLRAVVLSIPFALIASGAMGALEGLQEFRLISTRRVAVSIVQLGFPALVSICIPDLGWTISALAVSRILGMIVWVQGLSRTLPALQGQRPDYGDLARLLRFSGWLSISNIIGPLMTYGDRFYLASLFPPAVVASYTVPYDVVSRITVLPVTAIGAIFPAFAAAQVDSITVGRLLRNAITAMLALMFPPLLLVAVFSKILLTLWLGQHFATESLPIFKILMVGVLANSMAHVPYAFLQAHGRADVTAKLHFFELPIFVFFLLWATKFFGIEGAALAWVFRIVLDMILLYVGAMWIYPAHRAILVRALLSIFLVMMILPAVLVWGGGHAIAAFLAVIISCLCCVTLLKIYRQLATF